MADPSKTLPSSPEVGALPRDWLEAWGEPNLELKRQLTGIREDMEALAADLVFIDRSSDFSELVGSADLRNHPVHRWYYYKEGFSPQLPEIIVRNRGVGTTGTVVDPFAGVGTTALSLRLNTSVGRVIGVEYSPFASFAARTKIGAVELEADSLRKQVDRFSKFPTRSIKPEIPSLATYNNPDIFSTSTVHELMSARDMISDDDDLLNGERSFLLLGVASIIEDVSTAMKDGRALRILRGRKRYRQGLKPTTEARPGEGVHASILNQWNAMLEDLELISGLPSVVSMEHYRGDARSLNLLTDSRGERLIDEGSVGLYLYSPPYLNFIDYSEIYKLELWFLQMVRNQDEFRALREGTLRSHPSISFSDRPRNNDGAKVFGVIDTITEFLTANLARPPVGKTPGYYFQDMYDAFREQFITLEPGGSVACVVANSTLSRRVKEGEDRKEIWRMPILTDVILARLMEAAGFVETEIWAARDLRPKNVSGGSAREAIVVARKPRS